eukprot:COSAG02_NODE_33032_length_506_cov_1.687961_1_plen_51_part_01
MAAAASGATTVAASVEGIRALPQLSADVLAAAAHLKVCHIFNIFCRRFRYC